MNLERSFIFSCIEEDNIQRAYFRIHPLLTIEGDIAEEAHKIWLNDGCLRIVPDRAEQHTFKDRMRSMNGWCVVDLAAFPPETNKIRTNKNYHPDGGERNQYILYSDAVKALPERIFYEVLDGSPDNFATLAEKAVTPCFFIRGDDTLFGPVRRAHPEKPDPATETEAVLYTIQSALDGAEHTILCIASEFETTNVNASRSNTPSADTVSEQAASTPEAAPGAVEPQKEAASEEELPIGKPLQILDEKRTFEETLSHLNQPVSSDANLLKQSTPHNMAPKPALPLNGTPLMRTPMRPSIPQPKNRLQEVVSNQWRVVRNDPPCEPLPAGCAMKQIDNPVQNACEALRAAWAMPDAQPQLINFILSLDDMMAKLEPQAVKRVGDSPLHAAIQSRLTALEAERLAALVELDQARADLEASRKNAIASATGKTKQELEALKKNRDEMQQTVQALKEQTNALIAQRDELAKRIDELSSQEIPARVMQLLADCAVTLPVHPASLRLSPVCGSPATIDEMTGRIEKLCGATGINYVRNRAVALLVAMATSKRIGLVCYAPAAAATYIRNLCGAMGWSSGFAHQVTLDQRPLLACKPVDATPAVLLTGLASYAPLTNVCKLMLTRNVGQMVHNVAYEADQWPILPLGISGFVPDVSAEADGLPVSAQSLQALLSMGKIPFADIDRILAPMLALIPPLAGHAKQELYRFVSVCAHLMDGGLSSACDWAIMMWILPGLERTSRNVIEMKALLAEYPLSAELLGN